MLEREGEKIVRIAPDGLREGVLLMKPQLAAVVHRTDKSEFRDLGKETDLGVISRMIVSNAFLTILKGALAADANDYALLKLYKYHEWGTGTAAEAASNNQCLATATTSYRTANGTLDIGSQIEKDYSYVSVATLVAVGTLAITEHCLHPETIPSNTGMDRSLFTAIPLSANDSITFTYTLNLAGS